MSQAMEKAGDGSPLSSCEAFLEPIPPGYFSNNMMTTFDLIQRKIDSIQVNPELEHKVTRARLVECRLSSIPPGLTSYTSLTMLDLSENNLSTFSDSDFVSFPMLQTLYLSSNHIASFSVPLPYSITCLDLSFNKGFDAQSIWQMPLPRLEVLRISHCELKTLPSDPPIWRSTIRTLTLDGNFLTSLPSYLSDFPLLEELSLFGNSFRSICVTKFAQTLRILNLYFNEMAEFTQSVNAVTVNLNCNLFKAFPLKLLDSSCIRALTISKCLIKGPLSTPLPSNLFALDLSGNQISELQAPFVESLTSLTSLNLSHNQISSIADSIPQTSVVRLLLDFNRLSSLPKSFANNSRLEQLSVSHNSLSSIPEMSAPQLRIMNLSFNRLISLPDSFANSIHLTEVNLAFNNLSSLPRSLGSCRRIVDLNIGGNKLCVLPRCIMAYSQLKSLTVGRNLLSSLPESMSSLFFLQTLDLSNNHFSSIPSVISNFTSLKVLSVSHNRISEFPDSFCFPQSLTLLDLSFNKISSFGYSIPNAVSLNLSCNSVNSFNFKIVPSIKFLSLSNNSLNSPLPNLLSDLMALQNLNSVEIFGNKIECGDIPAMRFHLLHDGFCQSCSRFGIGCASMMGYRPSMEDCYIVKSYDEQHQLFALFDGHSGNSAASISSVCLVNEISRIINLPDGDVIGQLSKCFSSINDQLKKLGVRDGCTAASVLISGDYCYVAGIGDSRVILVSKDSVKRITVDAKPTDREEYDRLRKVGLTVNQDGRINRKLSVARALGDFWCGEGLFVEPQIYKFLISDEDDSIVIACDGVWDVVTDEAAAAIVRESQTANGAAASLKNAAFALSSKDNISVIVVKLHPCQGDSGLCSRNTVEELPKVKEEIDDEPAIASPRTQTFARRRR